MINNVVIMGRLTKDAEERKTSTGKSVCSFCVAVEDRFDRENDAYVNFFAGSVCRSSHNGTDCLSYLAALSDNHTHIVFSNVEYKVYLVAIDLLDNANVVRVFNDRLSNVDKRSLQIRHLTSPAD